MLPRTKGARRAIVNAHRATGLRRNRWPLAKQAQDTQSAFRLAQARPPLRGSVGLGLEDEAQVAGLVGGNHNLLGHFAVGFMPGGDGLFAGRKGRQAEGAAFVGDGIV